MVRRDQGVECEKRCEDDDAERPDAGQGIGCQDCGEPDVAFFIPQGGFHRLFGRTLRCLSRRRLGGGWCVVLSVLPVERCGAAMSDVEVLRPFLQRRKDGNELLAEVQDGRFINIAWSSFHHVETLKERSCRGNNTKKLVHFARWVDGKRYRLPFSVCHKYAFPEEDPLVDLRKRLDTSSLQHYAT